MAAKIEIEREVLEDLVEVATRVRGDLGLAERRSLVKAEEALVNDDLRKSIHPGQLQLFNPDNYR